MNMKKRKVVICGGSGYVAGELLSILLLHKFTDVVQVTSHSNPGKFISDIHPRLKSFTDIKFSENLKNLNQYKNDNLTIFSIFPSDIVEDEINTIIKSAKTEHVNIQIIDLGSFFRPSIQHPLVNNEFVYGLSEINRTTICSSTKIANPGCAATVIQLGLFPVLSKYNINNLCINFSSGASSSGSEPIYGTHFPIRNENYRAFKVFTHQHEDEIVAFINDKTGVRLVPAIIPHVGPWKRGMLASMCITTDKTVTTSEIKNIFTERYRGEPFVRFRDVSPEIRNVSGTNFIDISVYAKNKFIVILAAIDNLIKGGAGQAIQNYNLMNGFDETEGLWFPGGSSFN